MHTPAQTLDRPIPRAHARRSRVIEAARKLFAAKGFHNTGMAQIAAESDVKVGQIYRDFPCKEAIVAAIVEVDFATFFDTDALRLAIEQGDRIAVLAAIMGLFDYRDVDRLMPEIMAESLRNPRVTEIIDALDARFRTSLGAALMVFAPEDAARDARERLSQLLLTLVVGLCHRSVADTTQRHDVIAEPVRALVAREIALLGAASES